MMWLSVAACMLSAASLLIALNERHKAACATRSLRRMIDELDDSLAEIVDRLPDDHTADGGEHDG